MSFEVDDQACRDRIYSNMQRRTTEELLKIWGQNDREAWTDTAFEVIEEILAQRLDDVPPLGTFEVEELPPDVEEDRYHDPDVMIAISARSRVLAWIVLFASIVAWLVSCVGNFSVLSTPIPNMGFRGLNVLQLLSLMARSGVTLITGLFYFAVLLFISEAGYVLLDIVADIRERNCLLDVDEPA